MDHLSIMLLSAMPEGRVIGFNLQTVFEVAVNIFNIAVLALVLSWLLYKPVRKFMQGRSERIRSQFEGASRQEKIANELKAEYERRLAGIEKEKEEILQSARKLAGENSRRLLEEARAEADGMRVRAHTDIELERERVKDEMKQAIIEVSAEMTQKLVAISVDKNLQERLFTQTMQELEEVRWRS